MEEWKKPHSMFCTKLVTVFYKINSVGNFQMDSGIVTTARCVYNCKIRYCLAS